jgi:spore cortex biosynthesis protein YabQ
MVSLRLQFFTFLNMVIIGILVGVIFDFYRVLRWQTNPKKFTTDVFDLLFAIIVTIIIFIALVYSNGGVIRIYVFLGVILGQIIYYWLFSYYIILLFAKFIEFIYFIFCKIKDFTLSIYNNIKKIIIRMRNWIKIRFEK